MYIKVIDKNYKKQFLLYVTVTSQIHEIHGTYYIQSPRTPVTNGTCLKNKKNI